MRDDYQRRRTSVLVWMISIIIAGFIIQNIFEKLLPGGNDTFARIAAMSQGGLLGGHVWKLLTYTLLHGTGAWSLLVVLFNCLMLWFLGNELRPLLGEKGLVWLYVAAALGGALAWFGVNLANGGFLYGATSVVGAFLVVFACIHPDRRMTLLLFFVPVTTKPKYIAGIWALIALCGLVFGELPARALDSGLHYSAQLGGMLAGLLYHRLVYLREWRNPDGRTQIELPRWLRRTGKTPAAAAPAKYKVNVGASPAASPAPSITPGAADLRAEVDRILDKINSEGFGALTAEEKRLLDNARDVLSRR